MLGRFPVPHIPSNHVLNNILWPALGYGTNCTHLQPNIIKLNNYVSVTKSIPPSYVSLSSLPRLQHFGAVQISDVGETFDSGKSFLSAPVPDSAVKDTLNKEVQQDGYDDSPESVVGNNERQRRRKRKHGNKGKVPWNKGRKHSEETCALIKERTIEALRDPQVRKKMAEHARAHSDKNKAKISSSIRQLWGKRLRWKRLGEKFFLSWARNIATAAKDGGSDQEKLDWDSYDKLKEEIALQQLQRRMEKAKAKELAKIKAQCRTQAKAERMARVAQKRKEREEKAKAREKAKRKAHKKSKNNPEELSVANNLTLKQRLTKIRNNKPSDGRMISPGETQISNSQAWHKLDVELLKREKDQREVSLADQIRAAKTRRDETGGSEAFVAERTVHLLTLRQGG